MREREEEGELISEGKVINRVLKTTGDGSHTFFVPELDEHYHSTNGAIQEANHVFIKAGLRHISKSLDIPQSQDIQEIWILEIGFGTGLNAMLTLLEAEKCSVKVFYHSLELYPIPPEKAAKLNYCGQLGLQRNNRERFMQLHTLPWERHLIISPNFTLYKQKVDFSKPSDFKTPSLFNLIYFDAFAPEKQPNMWTEEIFNRLYLLCRDEATLTTYCAKGAVRRMLQAAGFVVERLPGPPGKREMLRAQKS